MGLIRTIIRRNNKKTLGTFKAQLLTVKDEKRKWETAARHTLREVGKLVQEDAKARIKNPPKTGRLYRYKDRKHRASAPGEAPANRSGNLRRSVFYKVENANKLTVSASASYAEFLETGTVNMAPRPFMTPSVKENSKKIDSIFRKRLNIQVKRG